MNKIPETTNAKISRLYGLDKTPAIAAKLEALLDRFSDRKKSTPPQFIREQDVMLITYADNLQESDVPPLRTLGTFCRERLKDVVSVVHLLPFFPYSSDDGFSVIDYRRVNPTSGDWPDVARLAENFDLCFDLVINHASASSEYFQKFLAGDEQYKNFFITLDPETDTSSVLRPRTSPLLHQFDSAAGSVWCWTTFSADQLDLNFAHPDVLLEFLDILLFYVSQGARIIRLDAIAYLWKTLGTSCAHLPETHLVVQLMRELLDIVAPHVILLTETNVPHEDNISYFGDGTNEAQVVYNFPLPPLVLHTLTAQNTAHLTRWAATLEPPSDRTTYLNFTASHDGVGVRPAVDILSESEFNDLVAIAEKHGGNVSAKNDQQGHPIPYELNINYFDALNNPNEPADPELEVRRFLLSQSIALVLRGMPAIYIHSLLGSRGWPAGVQQTGHARTINREKLQLADVESQLQDKTSLRFRIFISYCRLIQLRRQQKAFHPNATQTILNLGDTCFAVLRTSTDHQQSILALHNVTDQTQTIRIDKSLPVGWALPTGTILSDLITGEQYPIVENELTLTLQPYQFIWLIMSHNGN
jgi:glucosylglycerate phosphorylase